MSRLTFLSIPLTINTRALPPNSSQSVRNLYTASSNPMNHPANAEASSGNTERRYKGVRRRKWGKWVSEIRVPGSRERLWLGSYSTPEAAAVAHDTAVLLLRGPSSASGLNFPGRAAGMAASACAGLSPTSVQRVASDSGMAIDAELAVRQQDVQRIPVETDHREYESFEESEFRGGDISIDDMEIYL